jgi:hypothetical protein
MHSTSQHLSWHELLSGTAHVQSLCKRAPCHGHMREVYLATTTVKIPFGRQRPLPPPRAVCRDRRRVAARQKDGLHRGPCGTRLHSVAARLHGPHHAAQDVCGTGGLHGQGTRRGEPLWLQFQPVHYFSSALHDSCKIGTSADEERWSKVLRPQCTMRVDFDSDRRN